MARIVILDDHNDVCETIRHRLVADGHDVRTANLGEDAIDLGYLFEPDVLITDWDLNSGYDGFEVAEAFDAALENVKKILITGFDTLPTSSAKFFAKIRKPFSVEFLSQLVTDAVKDKRSIA